MSTDPLTDLSLAALRSRYPYQFNDTELGVAVAQGWQTIFARLCADVDQVLGEDKRGFHWSQVKEKFGSARFYYQLGGRQPELRMDMHLRGGAVPHALPVKRSVRTDRDRSFEQVNTEIRKLAFQAERDTQRVCLVCGKEGSQDAHNDYIMVLCPEHQAQKGDADGQLPLVSWETYSPGLKKQQGS